MSEKAKKGFKMPSSYTVLLIIIAIMAVLTWFIPAGAFIEGIYEASLKIHKGFGMSSWHRFGLC
ncbi:arginine-ornithine antiporter [Streptococcus pneumoniae]|nr:arginine-ornithine antiporter [Streptococcus pneumoniae]